MQKGNIKCRTYKGYDVVFRLKIELSRRTVSAKLTFGFLENKAHNLLPSRNLDKSLLLPIIAGCSTKTKIKQASEIHTRCISNLSSARARTYACVEIDGGGEGE